MIDFEEIIVLRDEKNKQKAREEYAYTLFVDDTIILCPAR